MVHAAGSITAERREAPRITVTVDPRVELLSVIFRLAGNPEYSQGKIPSYTQDADHHFSPFRLAFSARSFRQSTG